MSDEGKKKLYRDRENGMLGGVCAGLAEYFDIDTTLIRVLFVVFGLLGGWALVLYVVLWFVIPLKPEDEMAVFKAEEDESAGG